MSVARGGINAGHFYSNVITPFLVNMQFTVTPTNGLGITSLKSNGFVNNVFMHTSTTPTANNGMTNPNPANGFALIQLKQNFSVFANLFWSITGTTTGSIKIDNSAMTAGVPYVITTLGDATAAKWLAIGVPAGVTPAVGVSFVALTNGGAGNVLTSRVSTAVSTPVQAVQVVGLPSLSVNSSIAANSGEFVLVQFTGATNSSTTTPIPVAPDTASVVNLSLLFDQSSVTVDGL
jgi:uncharacterized protein YidB (DUF937 family)